MSRTVHHLELLNNIKTHVLKVHINCQGCVGKVRKLLCKIQGVYSVNIDSEEGKITVVGRVDCATLIKKLSRAGKHAQQIWSSEQIDPPSLPRNHNIQTLQPMENEQIELNNNHGIGLDGSSERSNHNLHHPFDYEDSISPRGGGVAVTPPYYVAAQYSPPADYQFYLQSQQL